MKKALLGITFLFFITTWAPAESSVWKVQKDDSVIYLGGTCHLLRASDFPLPPEFDQAYKASELLVFETNIGALTDPSTQQKLMTKGMYADGTTVEDHVSAESYKLLSDYCSANNIPLEFLKSFKPSMIVVTLMGMELMKLGVTQQGVDTFFYQTATTDGKAVEGLESIDEQIRFITEMGAGNVDRFITHSINDMETTKEDYESLVTAWRQGDVKELSDLIINDFKVKTPKLYKELLADRSANWMPLIGGYQGTPPVEFILVGVGHLVGPEGIIEALRKQGYVVEKL